MLELKYRQTYIAFDFSFFATMSLLMLMRDSSLAMIGLLTCLWHETGHFIAMRICGVKIDKLLFYGAGIKIVPDKMFDFTDAKSRFCVYAAGCALNFCTAFVLISVGDASLKMFAFMNMMVGIFNLLPLSSLDGGKILTLCIFRLCSFQNAVRLERFLKWLNVILIMVSLIAFAVAGRGNITLYITLCYLLISALSC